MDNVRTKQRLKPGENASARDCIRASVSLQGYGAQKSLKPTQQWEKKSI